MKSWQEIETMLENHSKNIPNSLFYQKKQGACEIKIYYCQPIMDLVKFIREKTNAKEIGATHHVMKIAFKNIEYPNARLEYNHNSKRIDIYIEDIRYFIEVKAISDMTIRDLYQKAIGVIESDNDYSDRLWIFYFYRIEWENTIAEDCHYLLAHIDIDILQQDSSTLMGDLIQMVEDSQQHVAKKLKVRPTLIIPLENLVKVDDLERIVKEKDKQLEEKDREIKNLKELIKKFKIK
jgi:hypothetical protein